MGNIGVKFRVAISVENEAKSIEFEEKFSSLLVDEDLIHFDGKNWRYFLGNFNLITNTIADAKEQEAKNEKKLLGWFGLTLQEIIDEYKDGDDEPLDGDGVDSLIKILKAKINLNEGNLTQEDYDKILG